VPPSTGIDVDENMRRWSPWVRASVFDFELVSRLNFVADTTAPMAIHIRHLDIPAAPAAPSFHPLASFVRPPDATFQAQVELVNNYADLRPDRSAEILAQLGVPLNELGAVVYLHPDRTRFTIELLGVALRLANFVEMRVKHALACRRPNEFSQQVQPMILTPAHGALPSGHATEAFTCATVLWKLLRASAAPPYQDLRWRAQLMRLAARIAINRTVAGVHFPVDSVAGAMLGLTLGHYFVARCVGNAGFRAWRFDGAAYPASEDFHWQLLYDEDAAGVDDAQSEAASGGSAYVRIEPDAAAVATPPSPILQWLWTRAAAEWT
jgi:membrane-associated phospholipid phosphatase